jgi:hypothetical protein
MLGQPQDIDGRAGEDDEPFHYRHAAESSLANPGDSRQPPNAGSIRGQQDSLRAPKIFRWGESPTVCAKVCRFAQSMSVLGRYKGYSGVERLGRDGRRDRSDILGDP